MRGVRPRVSRRIDVLFAPPWPAEAVRNRHVAVIDVLRGTTTIATALANGAAGVIAVTDPEEGAALARRLGRERVLLGGERHAVRIDGFDLDNSPLAYRPDMVRGKTVVFTTTNGTRALRAMDGAASIRAAALVNRGAVAEALAREDGDITIVCAGEANGFALDDTLGAGALVDRLIAMLSNADLSDAALGATLLYRSVAERLADAVATGEHAQSLARKGFAADIAFSAQLDIFDAVPTLRDGVLVATPAASPG